jgi:hypothetical protein
VEVKKSVGVHYIFHAKLCNLCLLNYTNFDNTIGADNGQGEAAE